MQQRLHGRLKSLHMRKERLVAFSDGVFAVIITIMVLELKVPHGTDLAALHSTLPVFLVYVLSFLYVGIYWNNHHHLLYACERINGRVMWSNLHLLFWLSLIPFATGWMGENHFAALPTALYGVSLLMPSIAYFVLQWTIVRLHGRGGVLAKALGKDYKGKLSTVLYLIAIPSAFLAPWIAQAIYVAVALMWLCPDRRIERALKT